MSREPWPGEPAQCACTTPTAATLEETLGCPAPWRYEPGRGWVHPVPPSRIRDFLVELADDAWAHRARKSGDFFCRDCEDAAAGSCGQCAGDRHRAARYEAIIRRVEHGRLDRAMAEFTAAVLEESGRPCNDGRDGTGPGQ